MSKFSVGDLAMTIYPIPAVEAGTVVALNRRLDYGDQFTMYGQTFTALAAGWLCSRTDRRDTLAYAETSLMPLRRDFAPEQQQAKAVSA